MNQNNKPVNTHHCTENLYDYEFLFLGYYNDLTNTWHSTWLWFSFLFSIRNLLTDYFIVECNHKSHVHIGVSVLNTFKTHIHINQ
jgi:hypothetical protein